MSKRERIIKEDSSIEYIEHPTYGCVAVHRNQCISDNVPSYMKYRYCREPRK